MLGPSFTCMPPWSSLQYVVPQSCLRVHGDSKLILSSVKYHLPGFSNGTRPFPPRAERVGRDVQVGAVSAVSLRRGTNECLAFATRLSLYAHSRSAVRRSPHTETSAPLTSGHTEVSTVVMQVLAY